MVLIMKIGGTGVGRWWIGVLVPPFPLQAGFPVGFLMVTSLTLSLAMGPPSLYEVKVHSLSLLF